MQNRILTDGRQTMDEETVDSQTEYPKTQCLLPANVVAEAYENHTKRQVLFVALKLRLQYSGWYDSSVTIKGMITE